MAQEWTETLLIIIPVAQQVTMGAIASKIMPDVDESKMFDDIRLSLTGTEPATHLMSECPCDKEMAENWRQVLLRDVNKPRDYPTQSKISKADELVGDAVNVDSRSITILTDRLAGLVVKEQKTVRLAKDKHSALTIIRESGDILKHVGLKKIPSPSWNRGR